jgi:NAD(P)-dependent dehydrogenase (short-subunit alcohol dehydrogenase family)
LVVGRATALRFAQEGARILAVDRVIASAEETVAMATQGGECVPFAADVTKEATLAAAMEAARARWGRIDILHNNVGVSIGGGDKPLDELHASFSKFASHRTGAVAGACLGRVGLFRCG